MVLLTRDRVSASLRVGCFSDYQPENTEQSLKHSTNLHRTFKSLPITTIISIQKAQKTAEALNETSKTDPKNHLKILQNRSKVSKAGKIK